MISEMMCEEDTCNRLQLYRKEKTGHISDICLNKYPSFFSKHIFSFQVSNDYTCLKLQEM